MMTMENTPIVVIDDEENILRFLTRTLEKKGYVVYPCFRAEDGLKKTLQVKPGLVITDIVLPDGEGVDVLKRIKSEDPEINVVLITAHASLETAIEAIRLGAMDYLIKPFKMEELLSVVKRALSSKRIVLEDKNKGREFQKKYGFGNLIGTSPRIQEVYQTIEKVASTEATVLIMGESGTGKELVARSIHYNSQRSSKPFVSINCAALPELLLESELFGYEKGSFTGAVGTKMGLLELAHTGTFFFDEIGEIPPHIQAKLLRVVQERELRHVGGLHDIKVDIRILAATSKDLKTEVQKGRFRDDLFYRLNVVPIHMPPLRERRDDIPILAKHFVDFYSLKHGIKKEIEIEEDALEYLKSQYDWLGNVRELENLVERIIMLSDDGRISRDEILKLQGRDTTVCTASSQVDAQSVRDLRSQTEDFEKQIIESVLRETNGNKYQAAKKLQLSRQSLQYKIKKYQLG